MIFSLKRFALARVALSAIAIGGMAVSGPALAGDGHPGDPYGHTSGPEWAGWGAGGFFEALGATASGKGPYGPYGAYGPPGFKNYGYYVPADAGYPRGGCFQQYPIYDSYGRFRGYRPVPVC